MSGNLGRGSKRLRKRALVPALCVAALAVPATASAAGEVPLVPDPSPPVASPGGPAPDAAPHAATPARTTTASRPAAAPVRQVAPVATPSAPVRAATTAKTTTTTRAEFRPPTVQSKPRKSRPAAAAAVRKPKPSRLAPLRLGIRYALPPQVPSLTADRLPLIAASALLAFLLASGSFLGLAFRLRRESFGG